MGIHASRLFAALILIVGVIGFAVIVSSLLTRRPSELLSMPADSQESEPAAEARYPAPTPAAAPSEIPSSKSSTSGNKHANVKPANNGRVESPPSSVGILTERELYARRVGEYPAQKSIPQEWPAVIASPSPQTLTRTNISQTDQALEQLGWGNVAFSAPSSIQWEETAQVKLVLGIAQSLEELKQTLEAADILEGQRVKVSDYMEATLTGAGFEIVAITPLRQSISEKEITEWRWDVRALQPGRRRLHLSLNAVLNEPSGRTRALRTFDRDIEVTITTRQRIQSTIVNNPLVSTFVAGIMVAAIGWVSRSAYQRVAQRRHPNIQDEKEKTTNTRRARRARSTSHRSRVPKTNVEPKSQSSNEKADS